MKLCLWCERELEDTEFYKCTGTWDGLTGRCKECTRKRDREHRVTHPNPLRDCIDTFRADHWDYIKAQKDYIANHPEITKERQEEDRVRHLKYLHEYRITNLALLKKRDANYRAKYPEKRRFDNMQFNLKKFGLTPDDYERILESQNNVCAICGKSQEENAAGKRLHVDHDHTTGKVRGLLCHNCNIALGLFNDDPNLLQLAIDYLERAQTN